ncbi:MAG: DJ-1/PfpI family protein [Coriobacteriia bacterium]|nr:DJ-1/PfpI family protein [Coriobacteriia bacterium]
MVNVLMVIAPAVFRDEEYEHPKQVLEGRGATITTASRAPGECRGKLGMTAEATIGIADAAASDYDAVVFIGGGGAEVFFDDPDAHRLAQEAVAGGGVVGAICIAPSILARAGLLRDVRATAFQSQREDLISHGAVWTGAPVEVSGPIVTANGPDAARAFGWAIGDVLGLP